MNCQFIKNNSKDDNNISSASRSNEIKIKNKIASFISFSLHWLHVISSVHHVVWHMKL